MYECVDIHIIVYVYVLRTVLMNRSVWVWVYIYACFVKSFGVVMCI